MATPVVMPRQGNSVESCIIVEWKKQPGDEVTEGDVLCDIETDKAVMEVESPAAGVLLAHFASEGDLVPVLETIAAIGAAGEDASYLAPNGEDAASTGEAPAPGEDVAPVSPAQGGPTTTAASATEPPGAESAISPRARNLASSRGLDTTDIAGTGPRGRIIERDVDAALAAQPKLSPVAQAMADTGEFQVPRQGTGPGGRIMSRDLNTVATEGSTESSPGSVQTTESVPSTTTPETEEESVKVVPVQGIRRVIAERMRESLLTTAQLTMNRAVDASALLDYRKRLKGSDEALGLQGVTINDLILFVTARTLARFPAVNALFIQDDTHAAGEVHQYDEVHLAFAVDTPRGLIVPVIRNAQRLSLRKLAAESKRLSIACQNGTVLPDEITGGTFTVTNLGSLGVESFTPILNPPQVAILGVGGLVHRPLIREDGSHELTPHLYLSLTVNHQVVDGAPGAHFLAALAQGVTELDLLLAV